MNASPASVWKIVLPSTYIDSQSDHRRALQKFNISRGLTSRLGLPPASWNLLSDTYPALSLTARHTRPASDDHQSSSQGHCKRGSLVTINPQSRSVTAVRTPIIELGGKQTQRGPPERNHRTRSPRAARMATALRASHATRASASGSSDANTCPMPNPLRQSKRCFLNRAAIAFPMCWAADP